MAIAAAKLPRPLMGVTAPRIAPPVPSKSQLLAYEAAAKELRINLYPWQKVAARYFTALEGKAWKYREVAVVVARQNGKTELLMPRILMGLQNGESILHTAQNRDIPRQTFLKLAGLIASHPTLDYSIRKSNGQEEINTPDGGRYKLVAPNASSRGETADLVLIDEVREQHDQDLMDAMLPTITARPNSQIIFLSNAGDELSVVLNDIRRRGDSKESRLAYLEWSAAPDRDLDDMNGWAEANPALGYGRVTLDTLNYFRANRPPTSFETEHLCRWVISSQPRLVSESAWEACRGVVEKPLRPSMGVNMDPTGTRASAVLAWQQSDGRVACIELREATAEGEPIDVEALGKDLRQDAAKNKVRSTAFASWTDADLARNLVNAKALDGKEFANASENFVRLIQSGRLIWESAGHITDDLAWTARKPHDSGAWAATHASNDHPITASLAAIRAVWLASAPVPPKPRIY